MPDAPSPPEVKLWERMGLCEKEGKEFDESKERQALGLPMPEGREPYKLDAAKERAQLAEREDREGQSELERERQALKERAERELEGEATEAQVKDLQEQVQTLAAQNDQLMQQMREFMGEGGAKWKPAEAPPPGVDMNEVAGPPTEEWSWQSILNWAKAREITITKGGFGLTKVALLNEVHTALQERGKEEAPETEAGDGE